MEIGRFVSTSFAKVATPKGAAPKAAETRKLNVYMVRGKGAVSILDDEDYANVFRSIFAGQTLEIDKTSGKADFLRKFFASDIVYLSLHSNPNVLMVGNGDLVEIPDLIHAYKDAGQKGPALVIVTGCKTIQTQTKVNIAGAMGIKPDTKKRAYIGYTTFTPGLFSDRYFRVFMALWAKPKPDGSYRTLEEARTDAKAFIQRQLGLQGEQTGKIARFAPLDQSVADWFTIIGDKDLKVTDL